jgi:hypothetical protein
MTDLVFGRTITDGRDRIPYRRALLEERTHNREQPVGILSSKRLPVQRSVAAFFP